MGKKIGKVLLIIVIVLVVVVAGALCFFRFGVSDYYSASEAGFEIPGLSDGFIPQGLSYDKANDMYYVTGYMKDGSASPVYLVNGKDGKLVTEVRLANEDGSVFAGHAGGLSVYHDKVYVAGGEKCCLYVFDQKEIMAAKSGDEVKCEGIVELNTGDDEIGVAFTAVYNDTLIAGEFYREQNYPTLEEHHMEVKGGTNHALAVGLKLDGLKATPVFAYSLPDQIQGMWQNDNVICLSKSYGLAFSHIYTYDMKALKASGEKKVLGVEVPLYILDEDTLVSDKKIAPMSEEIEIVDGKLYVMCESASNKYIFGKLTGAKNCYRTEQEFFEVK